MFKRLTLKHYGWGLLLFAALAILFTYLSNNFFFYGATQNIPMSRITGVLSGIMWLGFIVCLVVVFIRGLPLFLQKLNSK